MSVHSLIIAALRKAYKANPIAGFDVLEDDDDGFVIRHLFQNYRCSDGQESGLNLSPAGHLVIGRYFRQWQVNLTSSTFNSRDVLWLDRVCRMPYHIIVVDVDGGTKAITLFLMEAELAMRAKLVGNLDALKTAFEENPLQGL